MAPRISIKNAKDQMGTPAFVAVVAMVGVVVILGAVFLGKSDSGQIDVTAAIQNSNQANTDAGGDASGNVEAIPEAFKNMTNGGLVPQENQAEQQTTEIQPAETPEAGTTTPEENSEDITAAGE